MGDAANVDTVRATYEAFARGDVQGFLDRCAKDIGWEQHPTGNTAQDRDVPYMRARTGHDAVADFFREMDEGYEVNKLNPRAFLAGDRRVAALVEFELTVKATGKRVRDEEVHLFEFGDDGKVTAFRHFLDTAKTIEGHA